MKYKFIKQHLRKEGYAIYPHEMICGPIGCPHQRNRFVDVVACKRGKICAFEYKSSGDYLMRAIPQVENYVLSFDFVIVVAEVPRYDVSTNPKRGVNIREFFKRGVGFWTVEFKHKPDPDFPDLTMSINPQFKILREAQQQTPIVKNHEWVEQKFLRYPSKNPLLKILPHPNQKTLLESKS